jgi:protein-L-isoaspartate(D-aspartate) O-methyltransferase
LTGDRLYKPGRGKSSRRALGPGRGKLAKRDETAMTTDYAKVRANMVESQLRTNRITNARLIAAFESLPRERFVPAPLRGVAYIDEDLAIGGGRYLMEPRVLARLIQAADVEASDMVLDVACASGYASALMAQLAATVVAVESDAALAAQADSLLDELEVQNAVVFTGPLAEGCAGQGPYNVILLGGAVAEVPAALLDQLADGGRLVAVVVDEQGLGRATLMRRDGAVVSGRVLFDAASPLLPGFERRPSFVF